MFPSINRSWSFSREGHPPSGSPYSLPGGGGSPLLEIVHSLLTTYIRSGWAFLIPYLVVYLIYAWLKWPLNADGRETIDVLKVEGLRSTGLRPPCLLHVYWSMHALHIMTGALSLYAYWKNTIIHRQRLDMLRQFILWLLLGMLFYIPGIYMEFPSDPWEHYARINRWKELASLGTAMGWFYKQTYYFFAYSLLGKLPVLEQLRGLDIYQAALSLLLSWQYYRLARACGLRMGAAMLFTLAQSLLFGNDLFGFYRYYILSSSAFSQLGAIAAIRLAIHLSNYYKSAPGDANPILRGRYTTVRCLLALVLSLGLSGLNHVQGLAIGGLGIFAVMIWHAAKWGRRTFLGLVGLLLIASVGCSLLWARNPLIDSFYKANGWLNAWNGFDLFSTHSYAARRTMLILGGLGLLNLVAALALLRRNHIAGWLTVVPILSLQLAFLSIPLVNIFARASPDGIIAFHRLFFAIPAGLALVVHGQHLFDSAWLRAFLTRKVSGRGLASPRPCCPGSAGALPFLLLLLVLFYLVVTPTRYPNCNRIWNAWSSVPMDLRMSNVLVDFYGNPAHQSGTSRTFVVTSAATSNVLQAYAPISSLFSSQERLLHLPQPRSPSADLMRIEAFKSPVGSVLPFIVVPPQPGFVFTPQSLTGYLSGHWNPVEASLGHVRLGSQSIFPNH